LCGEAVEVWCPGVVITVATEVGADIFTTYPKDVGTGDRVWLLKPTIQSFVSRPVDIMDGIGEEGKENLANWRISGLEECRTVPTKEV
jgi:hypothetical protein